MTTRALLAQRRHERVCGAHACGAHAGGGVCLVACSLCCAQHWWRTRTLLVPGLGPSSRGGPACCPHLLALASHPIPCGRPGSARRADDRIARRRSHLGAVQLCRCHVWPHCQPPDYCAWRRSHPASTVRCCSSRRHTSPWSPRCVWDELQSINKDVAAWYPAKIASIATAASH